jgi:hypothetical protein
MRTPSTAPVVVGVNGSAASLAAVRLGARQAVASDRKLRVVHAFAWPDPRAAGAQQGYAQARRDAAKVIDKAIAAAQRYTPGVRVSGALVDGLPARVLLQQSRTAALLVLGDDDLALTGQVSPDSVLMQAVARAFCPTVVARGPRPPSGPLLAAVDGSPAVRRGRGGPAVGADRGGARGGPLHRGGPRPRRAGRGGRRRARAVQCPQAAARRRPGHHARDGVPQGPHGAGRSTREGPGGAVGAGGAGVAAPGRVSHPVCPRNHVPAALMTGYGAVRRDRLIG